MSLSRRSFLKLAGLTTVAAAGASLLAGCSLVERVTIIGVLNGEEMEERFEATLPGFISDYQWAFDLVMPEVRKQYANIPGFDQVEFKRDPDYPGNCKIQTDPETGKKFMYFAIRCNVIKGTVYIISNPDELSRHTITGVEIPDSLTEIPLDYAQKKLESEAESHPGYRLTLSDRADNRKIIKSADGKSFEAYIYYDLEKDSEA